MNDGHPTDVDYELLLDLRTSLRGFLRWSDERAAEKGLTPAHHQLLLAVRGHGEPQGPTIGDLASYLLLRHHSVVGLVDRAEEAGLVRRSSDPDNYRVVRLQLTDRGTQQLEALSQLHLEELGQLAPTIEALLGAIETRRSPAEG